MHLVSGMSSQPSPYLVGFVGGVVIHNQVNRHITWHGGVDFLEKGEKLRAAMATLETPNDLTRRHVQRREERGCAMALIIMSTRGGMARRQRQTGLRPVQRLDLTLLVNATPA